MQSVQEHFSQDPHKYPHLKMIGVNCTKPAYIVSLIREFRTATDLPLRYTQTAEKNMTQSQRPGMEPMIKRTFYDYALSYFQNGATAVGGCCTTVESHIRQVTQARRILKRRDYSEMKKWLKKPLAISKK